MDSNDVTVAAVTATLLNERIYPGMCIAENDKHWGRMVVLRPKTRDRDPDFNIWVVSTNLNQSNQDFWEATLLKILERNLLTPDSSV